MDMNKWQSAKWVGWFSQQRVNCDPILHEVSQAAQSGSQKKEHKAFSEALQILPTVLENMKAAPELAGLDMTKLRELQGLYIQAMTLYIQACELGMRQISEHIPTQYHEIRSKISLADSYWQSAAAKTIQLF